MQYNMPGVIERIMHLVKEGSVSQEDLDRHEYLQAVKKHAGHIFELGFSTNELIVIWCALMHAARHGDGPTDAQQIAANIIDRIDQALWIKDPGLLLVKPLLFFTQEQAQVLVKEAAQVTEHIWGRFQ
jgi:hypothetical protein